MVVWHGFPDPLWGQIDSELRSNIRCFFYQKVLGMSLFLDMVSTYNLKSYGNVLKQCFTYLIVPDWREINIYPGVRHLTPINIAYL